MWPMMGWTIKPDTGAAIHRTGMLSTFGTEGFEDPADVGVLQGEAELDADVAEAHVPELPEV